MIPRVSNLRLTLAVVFALLMVLALVACGDSTTTATSVVIAPAATAQATDVSTTTAPVTSAPATVVPATQPNGIPTVTALPATSVPATFTAKPPTAIPATQAPATTVPATTVPATVAPATSVPPTDDPATTPASGVSHGLIAYEDVSSGPDSLSTIYVATPDGRERREIGRGRSLLISPNGQQIAYLVPVAQPADATSPIPQIAIRILNIDGSGRAEDVCIGDGNAVIHLIRWSPRSRYIALSGTQDFGPGNIYLCNLETKKLGEFLKTSQGDVSAPYDWTADGNNVIWQSGVYNANSNPNIVYGDPDKNGTDAVALTNGQYRFESADKAVHFYSGARISPDGKTLAVLGTKVFFVSMPGQTSPLAGKAIDGIDMPDRVAWSPDGKQLAVSWGQRMGEGPNSTISLVDLTSGTVTKFADSAILGDWSR